MSVVGSSAYLVAFIVPWPKECGWCCCTLFMSVDEEGGCNSFIYNIDRQL
jgi:hypothetical protein